MKSLNLTNWIKRFIIANLIFPQFSHFARKVLSEFLKLKANEHKLLLMKNSLNYLPIGIEDYENDVSYIILKFFSLIILSSNEKLLTWFAQSFERA